MSKEEKYGFFENAQAVARLIPYGKVTSYGAIANYLGASKSARMVGYAMKAAANDSTVPAHRVLNRVGMLTGNANFSSPDEMEQKLITEGIKIRNNQVVDFEKHFWNPIENLL